MTKRKNIDIPWVEKYRPKSLKEMALPVAKVRNQRVDLADELIAFIKGFFREKKKINEENKKIRTYNRTVEEKKEKKLKKLDSIKSAVLLEGPPGVGKTSIVYALANDLNMQVIETNASDTRTRKTLEKKLIESTKTRGIMDFITETKQKIILIDEVDGLYGVQDKGAVPTILELIENTQFPIIMCSNVYKRSLQSLYNKIKKYEIKPLSEDSMIKIADSVLRKEGIKSLSINDLKLVVKKNNGDLRGVINDLQGITQGSEEESDISLLSSLRRDNTEVIFDFEGLQPKN